MTPEDYRQIVREEIAASEQRQTEVMRDIETTVLREFHKWASPAEARQRGQRDTLHAIELDLESLAERVKALESKGAA
jgi:hypothetical protein